METSGSVALWQSLLAQGVDLVFGYPGGAIMPVYDALCDFESRIKHVLVRHEQGAVHAAEGYARASGKVGVCIATSGPGATNLVTGIADAMMDSVPIVCITGQVFKDFLGTDAFQETDVIGITIPITKWNYQITSPEEIPDILAKAFYVALSGRPGPVVIDITKNAQIEKTTFSNGFSGNIDSLRLRQQLKTTAISTERLQEAAKLINEAKRPLLLVGHGVLISRATDQVVELSQRAGIPMACTLHGLSAVPSKHPNYVGMLGMHGNYGPNRLTNEADLLIAIGMRFDDRVTGKLSSYARNASVLHIDIDAAEIHKNVRATVPIIGDAKEALLALLPWINAAEHSAWFAEFKACAEEEFEKVIRPEIAPSSGKIRMAEIISELTEQTNGNAIVCADVGQHQMMSARYSRFQQADSWITSGGLGTMGFALPAALGAAFATRARPVVAVIGDGCFQMTIQELGTLAQEQVPVKVIVLNNNFLGMVRQWQELFFEKRYSFVELKNPNFVKVCEGFGVEAERLEERSQITTAIKRLLDFPGPYVLEVVCEKEENVFPMVPAGAGVSDIRLE